MFETLLKRAERRALQRARRRSKEVAERLAAELPSGVHAEPGEEGVLLSGRGIGRRFALDPELRWMIMGLIR